MIAYEDVLPNDPFERWHEVTCRNYSVTECKPLRSREFSAEVRVRPFGDLAISRIRSQVGHGVDLTVTRCRGDIRKDYRDDFFMWVGHAGTTHLQQAGRSVHLQAGDISLHDQGTPFTLSFSRCSAATMVIIPREVMLERFPQAERCVALSVPSHSIIARLAVAMASEALPRDGAQPELVEERVWNAALEVWITSIQASAPQETMRRSSRQDERLRTAQRYLLGHVHDADIDLARASADLHMSSRTLLRLFAARGTTPMHWLMEQRLNASRDALSSGRLHSVSEAAYAHGFRNLSHFSRSFKAVHGFNAQQLIQGRFSDHCGSQA